MEALQNMAVLLSLAAVFYLINEKVLRLQATIGLMLISFIFVLGLALLDLAGLQVGLSAAVSFLRQLNFRDTFFNGMLCFLLFAGGLQVPLKSLEEQKATILALAFFATLLATFITGVGIWLVLDWLGLGVSIYYALLFGAIISPTDPIAALAILTKAGLPTRLETLLNGESLFNDGLGMVLFVTLSQLAFAGGQPSAGQALVLFGREVLGGLLLGLSLGLIAHYLIKSLKEDVAHLLVTLATVTGGYAAAEAIQVSGPLAMVVAGILVGNYTRQKALLSEERRVLDTFWQMSDEILDAVLFVFIGLIAILLHLSWTGLLAAMAAVGLVLLARALSVAAPLAILRFHEKYDTRFFNLIKLLTWGGLRGGLPVAMAMSLPQGSEKELIITMTYGVVLVSILLQGLTIGRLFSSQELQKMAAGR